MTNNVRERIGFHCLLTEIRLCSLILLELNIFRNNYETKAKTNQSYLEYNLMILLCVDFVVSLFIEYINAGKNFVILYQFNFS